MAETVIAFALFAATFAYLSVNIPERHGALQIFHILMAHITIFFTGFLSFAFTATGEDPAGLLTVWVNSYFAPLGLVFAYFLIFMLDVTLLNMGVFGDENKETETGKVA